MEIILTSIIAFASTNLDDLFILMLFFGDQRYKADEIYFGQYLGIILLIGVSVIGSFIGNFMDSKYIGLMGLFPIYLGLKQLMGLINGKSEEELKQNKNNLKIGILAVATVTVSNGGDNIGTYIPLFATLTTTEKFIMITLFLVMVYIWLTAAKYLRSHPILTNTISKYAHVITPIILCLLGIFILKENGTFELLK